MGYMARLCLSFGFDAPQVKPIISLMKRKALRQDLLETLASIVMDLSPDSMVVSYIKAVSTDSINLF